MKLDKKGFKGSRIEGVKRTSNDFKKQALETLAQKSLNSIFTPRGISGRLRKTFKIKACKFRGVRRTSVRRNDEECRTTPSLDVLRSRPYLRPMFQFQSPCRAFSLIVLGTGSTRCTSHW